jgi:fatty acid desaturase
MKSLKIEGNLIVVLILAALAILMFFGTWAFVAVLAFYVLFLYVAITVMAKKHMEILEMQHRQEMELLEANKRG